MTPDATRYQPGHRRGRSGRKGCRGGDDRKSRGGLRGREDGEEMKNIIGEDGEGR